MPQKKNMKGKKSQTMNKLLKACLMLTVLQNNSFFYDRRLRLSKLEDTNSETFKVLKCNVMLLTQLTPKSTDLNSANRLIEPFRSNKPVYHDRTIRISYPVIQNKLSLIFLQQNIQNLAEFERVVKTKLFTKSSPT